MGVSFPFNGADAVQLSALNFTPSTKVPVARVLGRIPLYERASTRKRGLGTLDSLSRARLRFLPLRWQFVSILYQCVFAPGARGAVSRQRVSFDYLRSST